MKSERSHDRRDSPAGLFVPHPFHYAWGWNDYAWYHRHHYYWNVYDVYPTPSYWVTDWLIGSYVADRYAAAVSLEQAREDARLARLEAEKAKAAAEVAREAAEIEQLHAAHAEAEDRLKQALKLVAKAELEETRAKSGDQQMIDHIDDPANRGGQVMGQHVQREVDAVRNADLRSLMARIAANAGPIAICLTGGSGPEPLYRLLATENFRNRMPWRRVCTSATMLFEPGSSAHGS